MVDVGVAAQDGHRGEAGLVQRVLQVLPLLHRAGVQEDAPVVVQFVEGDELPAVQDPGVPPYLCEFHRVPSLIVSPNRVAPVIQKLPSTVSPR